MIFSNFSFRVSLVGESKVSWLWNSRGFDRRKNLILIEEVVKKKKNLY